MNARHLTRRLVLATGGAALAAPALPQGFAGLGTTAEGFAVPSRRPLAFPADHGAHPAFRIEWWYLTANLTDAAGRDLGIQWTLFRSALRPPREGDAQAGWQAPQLWMGHAGLTTPGRHFHAERLARGGVGQAGVRAGPPFEAWIDEWRLAAPPETRVAAGADALDRLEVTAAGTDFAYRLRLDAEGPLVLQGEAGYSVKSPEGQSSRYYSQPFYRVAGTLDMPGGPVDVSGRGWLDREWSSQPLSETQDGWDWISLHLDTGEKLMGFRLRDRAGAPFTSATHVTPQGRATPYGDRALRMTPIARTEVAGRRIPTRWQVTLPDRGLDVTLEAVNAQAFMDTTFPYWEGPVRITGSHGGRGYLEMTGYAPE